MSGRLLPAASCGENLPQPRDVLRGENGRKGCDSTIVTHRGSSANWAKAAMAGSVHAAGRGRGCSLNLVSHWESGAAVNRTATSGSRAGSRIVGPGADSSHQLAGLGKAGAAAVGGK